MKRLSPPVEQLTTLVGDDVTTDSTVSPPKCSLLPLWSFHIIGLRCVATWESSEVSVECSVDATESSTLVDESADVGITGCRGGRLLPMGLGRGFEGLECIVVVLVTVVVKSLRAAGDLVMAREREVMICSMVVIAVELVVALAGVPKEVELIAVGGGTLFGLWILAVAQPAVLGLELTDFEVEGVDSLDEELVDFPVTVFASVVVVLVATACVTTGTASGTLPLRFPNPDMVGLSGCVGVFGADTCLESLVVTAAEERRESLGAMLGLFVEVLVGVRCREW